MRVLIAFCISLAFDISQQEPKINCDLPAYGGGLIGSCLSLLLTPSSFFFAFFWFIVVVVVFHSSCKELMPFYPKNAKKKNTASTSPRGGKRAVAPLPVAEIKKEFLPDRISATCGMSSLRDRKRERGESNEKEKNRQEKVVVEEVMIIEDGSSSSRGGGSAGGAKIHWASSGVRSAVVFSSPSPPLGIEKTNHHFPVENIADVHMDSAASFLKGAPGRKQEVSGEEGGRVQGGNKEEKMEHVQGMTEVSISSHTPLSSRAKERLRAALLATPCIPSPLSPSSMGMKTAEKGEGRNMGSSAATRIAITVENQHSHRNATLKEAQENGPNHGQESVMCGEFSSRENSKEKTEEGVRGSSMSSSSISPFYIVKDSLQTDVKEVVEPRGRGRRNASFLSSALYAVYLVTMIEKSQRGGGHSGGMESYEKRRGFFSHSSFSTAPSAATASSSLLTSSLPPLASVLVTGRWLDGVSQLLNGSPLTLDDLAYLAHIFPQWLRMKWSCSQSTSLHHPHHNEDTAGVCATGVLPVLNDSLLSSFSSYNVSSSSKRTTGKGDGGRRRPPPPLQARVYLIGDHVISIEEAYTFLEQRVSCEAVEEGGDLGSKSTATSSLPSSSLSFSAMNPLHGSPITAYQAYLSQQREQQRQRQGIVKDKQEEREKEKQNKTLCSIQDTNAKLENKDKILHSSPSPSEQSSEENANHLLSTALSPELLQSLSKEKLAHVLKVVEKDLSGEEEKQYKDIRRRQVREDILRTYTRIRSVIRRRTIASLPFLSKRNSTSLFAKNEKKHISLSQLMIQLQADNDNGGGTASAAGRNSHLSNSGTHSYTTSGAGTASRWSAESEIKAENLHLLQVIEELIRIPSSGLQLQNLGDLQQEEGRDSKVVGGANSVPCTSPSSFSLISLSTLPAEEWHRVILCFDQCLASAKEVAAAVEVG